MNFDIETVSDVLSLLFKLHDKIDMKFEADKDDEGNFKPSTVKLSSAPPPFLCIPVARYHKLGRLPLRFAPVGAKQASPGRLTPCHGYFP